MTSHGRGACTILPCIPYCFIRVQRRPKRLSPCGVGGELGEANVLSYTSDQLHCQVEFAFLSVARELSGVISA